MIYFEYEPAKAAAYFAAEEYIMQAVRPGEAVVLLWRIDDTVVIGANQLARAECDLEYARSAGIAIARRPSGGGAIFSDRQTLEYTIILPYKAGEDAKSFVRDWLAPPVIAAIARYGAKASLEGRNDILLEGKKISGVSQYVKNGYICSHGTLLFDTNLEKLARVLTVDREKIATKAVSSVRSRVTKIADHIGERDLDRFKETLIACYGEMDEKDALHRRKFEPDELARIEELMKRYESAEWVMGREPAFTYTNKKRFPGGAVEVFLDVKGGVIRGARITGDFLALRPVAEIEMALNGVEHRKEAIAEALREVDVSACLGSLDTQELLDVLV